MIGSRPRYAPRRPSRTIRLPVRGLDYCIRCWGPASAPPLVMVHGARDNAATFQFLVDAFAGEYRIIAPDWRGHGATSWTPGSYWLADFVCDLDTILEALLPGGALPIVGHSMGANVASLFAAVRPERMTRLVMLDALGSPLSRTPLAVVDALSGLLAELREVRSPRAYESVDAMAARLMRANRRLGAAQAQFLAQEAARATPDGFVWPHDPTFQRSLPTPHTLEEWGAFWRRIAAPVLSLLSSDPRPDAATDDAEHVRQRTAYFADLAIRRVPETGHNLHQDEPEIVAAVIEAFLAGDPGLPGLLGKLPPAI